MQYVTIAKLGKPFGLKGQVHAFSLTSFPQLRFKKGRTYVLQDLKGKETTVTLTSFSIKGDALVLGFAEIPTPEEASAFYGQTLNLDKEQAPMPEGYVRYDEIVGFNAIDDAGKKLGSLLDVLENAPTPSLKFKSVDGKVFYVPFIDAFVGEIDYQEKTIRIHVVEGML